MVVFFSKRCKWVGTWLAAMSAGLLLSGCSERGYQLLSGSTMGTYYRIQANCPVRLAAGDVDERLRRFNAIFSTYEPTSELSQLNLANIQQWRAVSEPLMSVLEAADVLVRESGGAFDPTIGALVNLWGFGPENEAPVPDAQALAEALAQTGFEVVKLDPGVPAVRSAEPRNFDLSAIAKGRAVDELSAVLRALNCAAALVDIGGEIRVFGVSPSDRPWRLAIEQPGALSARAEALPVLNLTDGAVATSGDYRNYRELHGRRLSHLIDPRSARPITHRLASVTVWHPEAMWADGYATAISILGPEAGQALAIRAKLAVAMLIRTEDGRFSPWMSDAFVARFVTPNPVPG